MHGRQPRVKSPGESPCIESTLRVSSADGSTACRYYVDEQWRARKMEVLAAMPEVINLEPLRATGAQPAERIQPEQTPTPAAPAVWPPHARRAHMPGTLP